MITFHFGACGSLALKVLVKILCLDSIENVSQLLHFIEACGLVLGLSIAQCIHCF